MARLDPSIAAPSVTSRTADRADCYRLAVVLLKEAAFVDDITPDDALYLAQFLAHTDV